MTLAEAIETVKECCKKNRCASCVFGVDGRFFRLCGLMREAPCYWETPTETNIYDSEEIKEEREKREKEEE